MAHGASRTAKRRLARPAAKARRAGAVAHVCRGRRGGARLRLDRLEVEPARREPARCSGCRPAGRRAAGRKLNQARLAKLEREGRMAAPGRAAVAAAKRSGTWTALDAVEALEVPVDLGRALSADERAKRHFDAFPPSARKGILTWIADAKREETRGGGSRRPSAWLPGTSAPISGGRGSARSQAGSRRDVGSPSARGGASPSAGRRRPSRRSRSRARRRARCRPAGG